MTAPGGAVRLTCSDVTIGVSSATAAPVRWLEEFLEPWFRVDRAGTVGVTVTLTLDGERLRALRRDVGAGAALVDTFVLDSRVTRCPALEHPRGRWTVLDEAMGAAACQMRSRAFRHVETIPSAGVKDAPVKGSQ